MLSIHQLQIRYGETLAVQNFNLQVDTGEVMALVGPTGCGKSSVLRSVAGLCKPDAGQIVIEGLCTSGRQFIPPEKRRTGLVFQDFALFPHLNVEQNIGFRVKAPDAVETWISALGLELHRQAMPETLRRAEATRRIGALARAPPETAIAR